MFGQRAAALSETSQMPKVAEHGVAFISGFRLRWGSTSMKTVGGWLLAAVGLALWVAALGSGCPLGRRAGPGTDSSGHPSL